MNELVERAKNKDSEAYSMLVMAVEADLMKFAMKMLKNYDDAQDVVQETMYTAYLNIDKLKDNDKFKPWIIGILKRKCKKFYANRKYTEEITEDIIDKTEHGVEDRVDFDIIMDKLHEKESEVFRLYFEEELTTKQISKRMNINENTLKTMIRRGKDKLERKGIKRFTIFIWILCIFIATSVIAISLIHYIKSLFDTTSEGVYNEGILQAIESSEWFQQVDMDYIDLGDGYKIRFEYLLMDEMNLYMVYELQSEENIGKYEDIYMQNLKIVDEEGNIICNEANMSEEQYNKKSTVKQIENKKHSIKELVYMFTDSFPKSKTLRISFSKITLVRKLEKEVKECENIEVEIKLDEKFIKRNYVEYSCDSNEIEKAIVTETGFYAIISNGNSDTVHAVLDDNAGNIYECYTSAINNDNNNEDAKNIVVLNFKDIAKDNLKLIIDGKVYELVRLN